MTTTATMHSAPSPTARAPESVAASTRATVANEAAPAQKASAASPATGTTRVGDQAVTPGGSGRAGYEAICVRDRADAGGVGLRRLLLVVEGSRVVEERRRRAPAARAPPRGVGVLEAKTRLPPSDVGTESLTHSLVSRSLRHHTLL